MAKQGNPIGREQFDANLAHYQKMFERAMSAESAAGNIGMFVLKILMTINGGALIALMAASERLAGNHQIASSLSAGGKSFLGGLLAAAVAAAAAYFYQAAFAKSLWDQMEEDHGGKSAPKWVFSSALVIMSGIVIPLCVASFFAFANGAHAVLSAMEMLSKLS